MHIEKAVVTYNSFFYLKGNLRLGSGHTNPKKKPWSHKKLKWQKNKNADTIWHN